MASNSTPDKGISRRVALAAASTVGLTAVSLSTGLPSAEALPAEEASASVTGNSPRRSGGWHRYVQGPSSRTVRPVRITTSTGDVKNPNGLLKPGGARSVLRRPQPAAAPTWPTGTTAEASSAHAGNNGNDGQPRTYDAGNAVDGNPDTFWNDDTLGVFPDVLTITAPQVTPCGASR